MEKITDEMKELIEGNALAIATVDENGNPHCIAVADVKVVSDDKLLIGDNYMKFTKDNLLRNNNVALVVWNKEWERNCIGYQIKGKVEYFNKGKWLEKVKEIHKEFPAKGAILVTVERIKKLA